MASRRTFDDVITTVAAMTGRRPDRSSDNLGMTRRLAERLGLSPMLTKLKVVHVAGTKGKGTTCTFTSKLLRDAYGKNVGLFTSPHLFDVRERIQINNTLIPKDRFTEYFFDIHDRMSIIADTSDSNFDRESASRANFFRFMFLLSLHAFQQENVEVAVYEVGIGGRLDATNIFPHPAVCGITMLGMDHMEILGDTVEKIAFEKAGIMKPDVPCFSSPQQFHPSTRQVLMDEGRKVGAPVIFLDDGVIPSRRWPALRIGGDHFVENSKLAFALARTAVGIPVPQPIVRQEWDALENTRIEGRSEMIRVIDPEARDPKRQRSASLLMKAIAERNAAISDNKLTKTLGGAQPSSPQESAAESTSLVPMDDLAFYLDGAHNPESMQVMTKWFFSVAPRGLLPMRSRPSTPTQSTGDALPPTPPTSPRTAAGVSKVLPSHMLVTPSAANPSQLALTRVRTTILFYSTRNPKDMLRYFMPYAHLIDKIVFCLIPNPKQTLEGNQREAAEDDRLALSTWTESWRNLYREIPCYAVRDSFVSMEDCLEVVRGTPFRKRTLAVEPAHYPPTSASSQGQQTSSVGGAQSQKDLPELDPEAIHTEDRVLVTGSVLFVGDMLKMMHDVGLYPDV